MLKFSFHKPLKSYTRSHPNKVEKLVLPRWYSKVELGEFSYMNDACDVQSFRSPQVVKIGKYCSIGECKFVIDGDHNVKFASTYPFNEFDCSQKAPPNAPKRHKHAPTIQNDVWIADGSVIFGGVTVGNGAVIAGQAVVTKNVPPYAIVAGNPARVVKYRFPPEVIARFEKVKWWDLPHDYICESLAEHLGDVEAFLSRAENYTV